jgi:aspartyl-tRNA(Asn)/glutamyl-tRNA(Gln) amidotransferase subunit C
MGLAPEQVRKIAELARLELTEEEVQKYATQLSNILAYIEKLNELDVSSIEPTAHAVSVPTPFREDAVTSHGEKKEPALKQAPDRDGDFFRVPKVL